MNGRLRPESAQESAVVARASSFDDDVARERGRLAAARAIIENPDQRKNVEEAFGLTYCQIRWPEAYDPRACRDVVKFIPRLNYEEPADKPDYDDSGLLITKL